MEWTRGDYRVTDSNERADIDFIAESLGTTYWANNRPKEIVEKSVRNSIVLSMYDGDRPIGFSRVVSDHATFAWICDVFVHPDYRSEGLGVWLVDCTLALPCCDVRLNLLGTKDAHTLYEKFGFESYQAMIKRKPGC